MVSINNEERMSLDDAKSLFYYDALTGHIKWQRRVSTRSGAGSIAGSIERNGYRRIVYQGRHYNAHRLVWFLKTGEWPESLIDHVNGDKDDNRFENLRLATFAENNANASGVLSFNKSGFRGVAFRKNRNSYIAYIYIGRKMKYLGSAPTAEAAAKISAAARLERWGEFAERSIAA